MSIPMMDLDDLDLPSVEDLDEVVRDGLLRFFDDDEHIIGDECPCAPQIISSRASRSGLLLIHNKYNLVSRDSICSLQP